jgi:caffeoyl-CoA O-methyltransferase
MLRNIIIVLMAGVILSVAGGVFVDVAAGDERDREIALLQASLAEARAALIQQTMGLKASQAMTKALVAEKAVLGEAIQTANEAARKLKRQFDEASVQLGRFERMAKHNVLLVKDLRADREALRNELTSDNKSDRMGFTYGGAPKIDSPPVARDAAEKKALAALAKMAKGKWHLNITTREGRVLRQLVEASGAKRVVEIGTSSGYSTIWLAMGARAAGGRVITHEIDPKMIKIAQANFKLAGVDDIVTIVKGDAHETIKQLKQPIDAVFLDAEKKGYVDYLAKLLPLVRPGGLILGHDMRRPKPDPRYIKAITTNTNLDTSFIMMESFGISLTVKKR